MPHCWKHGSVFFFCRNGSVQVSYILELRVEVGQTVSDLVNRLTEVMQDIARTWAEIQINLDSIFNQGK